MTTASATTARTVLAARPANAALVAAQAAYNAAMDALNAQAAKHTARTWLQAVKPIKAAYTAAVDAAIAEDAALALHQDSDFDGQEGDGSQAPTEQGTTLHTHPQDNPLLGHCVKCGKRLLDQGDGYRWCPCDPPPAEHLYDGTGEAMDTLVDPRSMPGAPPYMHGHTTPRISQVHPLDRPLPGGCYHVDGTDRIDPNEPYHTDLPHSDPRSTTAPWTEGPLGAPLCACGTRHYGDQPCALDAAYEAVAHPVCTACGIQVPHPKMRCDYCHTNGVAEEGKASNHTHCATTPCLSCQAEIADQEREALDPQAEYRAACHEVGAVVEECRREYYSAKSALDAACRRLDTAKRNAKTAQQAAYRTLKAKLAAAKGAAR